MLTNLLCNESYSFGAKQEQRSNMSTYSTRMGSPMRVLLKVIHTFLLHSNGHAVTTVGTAAHATEYKGKLGAACS